MFPWNFFPPKKQEEGRDSRNGERAEAVAAAVCLGDPRALGGSTQSNTLEICERLIATCGYEIMPHLTGVTADRDKVNGFLSAIKAMGIENVLALRGDRPAGFAGTDAELFGAFPHASDLVTYIREHHPQLAIGVAGFPEAHGEAPSLPPIWRSCGARWRRGQFRHHPAVFRQPDLF